MVVDIQAYARQARVVSFSGGVPVLLHAGHGWGHEG